MGAGEQDRQQDHQPNRQQGDRAEAMTRLEREISLLFRRSRGLSSRLAGRIHPDLDAAGYGLLATIMELDPDGDGVRAVALSDRIQLHKSTLSRSLTYLEELGLVERVRDPEDARARLVTLTPTGRTAVRDARAGRSAMMLDRLSEWDAEDLARLADLLGRFSRALDTDD